MKGIFVAGGEKVIASRVTETESSLSLYISSLLDREGGRGQKVLLRNNQDGRKYSLFDLNDLPDCTQNVQSWVEAE